VNLTARIASASARFVAALFRSSGTVQSDSVRAAAMPALSFVLPTRRATVSTQLGAAV
jgi:hypothetical protein